jgi:hypothetical protein
MKDFVNAEISQHAPLPCFWEEMVCLNYWNTSEWAGDRLNTLQLKLGNPLAGQVGNFSEFAVNVLQHPVLLFAKIWHAASSPC